MNLEGGIKPNKKYEKASESESVYVVSLWDSHIYVYKSKSWEF